MTTSRPVLAASVAALPIVVALLRRRRAAGARWRSVTIAVPEFDVAASPVLQPLRSTVEFRTVQAGDRGLELHARGRSVLASPERIRTALREAKQIAETGEVLRVVPRPHGPRKRSVLGSVQDLVEHRAKGMGLL